MYIVNVTHTTKYTYLRIKKCSLNYICSYMYNDRLLHYKPVSLRLPNKLSRDMCTASLVRLIVMTHPLQLVRI